MSDDDDEFVDEGFDDEENDENLRVSVRSFYVLGFCKKDEIY